MRVLILHDHVSDTARPDESDTLAQSRAVSAALEQLGHEWMTLGLTLDLDAARTAIERLKPELVFNLVESLGGFGRLIHVPMQLLDAMHVAYTGAPSEAVMLTSGKLLAKHMMAAAGIPTPKWVEPGTASTAAPIDASDFGGTKYIIKSVWEHASIGLDNDSIVIPANAAQLHDEIASRRDRMGGEAFAEQYVEGREFNIAMLGHNVDAKGPLALPELLPPCEIVFENFDDHRARIVNYNAKWDESSYEYAHTPRCYAFAESDRPVLQAMKIISLHCWRLFKLRGHARVDFRVDAQGKPWVLEVNANPCLSHDAGFAAALAEGAIPYSNAIDRIAHDVPNRAENRKTKQTVS